MPVPGSRTSGVRTSAATAAACSQTPPERQAIGDAAEALGGAERLQAVRTIVMEGGGLNGAMGGSVTPDEPPNTFKVTEYRRTLDLQNGRMRLQQVRTAQFPFALATVNRFDQRLDGDIGFNVGQQTQRTGDAVSQQRRRELLEHPVAAVRAALDPAATVSNVREEDGLTHVDIRTAKGDMVTLAIDPASKLPNHVSHMEYSPEWGDVEVETTFADYESVGGLQLPRRFTTKTDRFTTADITLTRNLVDVDAGDLAAPETVRAAAAQQPAPVNVTVEPVGKGIWWLAGGSHHSVVFEFDDHLTIFEVPLNDARTQAVIARAKTLVPGKPLTHAVVSHHHLDHAGGFRAAVAEGLTIITHRGNEAFLRDIASRRHTIRQDALAMSPKDPKFEFVDDQLTLKDGTNEVHLFKANGNIHTGLLVYAWVPRDRTLIQADFYDVNWLQHPWGDNFIENLAARKLMPARHVPIHGKIQTHPEVLQTLASKPKAAPPATTE
jgi:glyoxylase-like metal-dependent hydrolase (beta-lactamase superfamily II)